MGIFTVVLLGAVINLIFFVVANLFLKNYNKSASITMIMAFLMLIISLIVGGFSGIGLTAISIGMMIMSIIFYVYQLVR